MWQGEHNKHTIITPSVLSVLCGNETAIFCLGAHPAVKFSCDHEEHWETSHPHLSRTISYSENSLSVDLWGIFSGNLWLFARRQCYSKVFHFDQVLWGLSRKDCVGPISKPQNGDRPCTHEAGTCCAALRNNSGKGLASTKEKRNSAASTQKVPSGWNCHHVKYDLVALRRMVSK